MERYIGMDVHAASCTLAVISEKGRKLRDFPVETSGQALGECGDPRSGEEIPSRSGVSRYREAHEGPRRDRGRR